MPDRVLIVGSRASVLALRQTNMILAALRRRFPAVQMELRHIHTTGDHDKSTPLHTIGGQGVFVKEIEEALARGEIDLAVHSLKDLPGTLRAGLALGAIPKRADARDALIARSGMTLADLPHGATIGTGAARRIAQLQAARPDCIIHDLRGNVDTRLRKAMDAHGPYDAIVLALAGLKRLRRAKEATEILPFDTMLPAPGQGALGLEIRADDTWACDLIAPLNDPTTHRAVSAERAFLVGLGGGCQAPIAALGRVRGQQLWLTGMLALPNGTLLRHTLQGNPTEAEAIGHRLAREILSQETGRDTEATEIHGGARKITEREITRHGTK